MAGWRDQRMPAACTSAASIDGESPRAGRQDRQQQS
jgi:hypothetical protein